MIKIGINGFGRIGRMTFRAAMQRADVQVVAVNDLLELPHLAYLLRHDSVHGRFGHDVAVKDRSLTVDGRPIRATAVKDPAASAWGDAGVDVVIESTGIFLTQETVEGHLRAGARRAIISAPAKDDTPVFVHGVNTDRYAGEPIISAASCTTNCLAPIAKVVDEAFGIKRMAFRVPVSDVSVVDLTCELVRETRYADICAAMKAASEGALEGVLGYTDEEVVSSDLRGDAHTSIFDARAGIQLDPTFVKLIAWYDNEWGYSSKLLDLAVRMSTETVAS